MFVLIAKLYKFQHSLKNICTKKIKRQINDKKVRSMTKIWLIKTTKKAKL